MNGGPGPTGVTPRERLRQLIRAPRLPIDLARLSWVELFPGVRVHLLECCADGVPRRALIWLDVGATVPEHSHETPEDVLIMKGTLALYGNGEGVYEAGQIFHSPAGKVHSARVVGDRDCLCHVVYWPPERGPAAGDRRRGAGGRPEPVRS